MYWLYATTDLDAVEIFLSLYTTKNTHFQLNLDIYRSYIWRMTH